jgi:hypothetical protein
MKRKTALDLTGAFVLEEVMKRESSDLFLKPSPSSFGTRIGPYRHAVGSILVSYAQAGLSKPFRQRVRSMILSSRLESTSNAPTISSESDCSPRQPRRVTWLHSGVQASGKSHRFGRTTRYGGRNLVHDARKANPFSTHNESSSA